MKAREGSPLRTLVASVGIILIITGLIVLLVDAVSAGETKAWRGSTLYDFLTAPWTEHTPLADDFALWLKHPRTFVFMNGPISFLLDMVPQSLALMTMGVLIVWKGMR
jgi:hypothetical protein